MFREIWMHLHIYVIVHKIKYNRNKALHAFKIVIMKSVGLGSSLILPEVITGNTSKFPSSLYSLPSWLVPVLEGGMVLPYGVVHPGHCEEGSKIGRVGGAHDEGEEPPASHHDAHGHGVHGGLATCGRSKAEIGSGLPFPLLCHGPALCRKPPLWWAGDQGSDCQLSVSTVTVRKRP